MLQTPIVDQRRGSHGSGRRYQSHLDLSNGSSLLRPRTCSTSMVTVTESTPELRSPADYRRLPATPCSTPCFISPHMAFTTQFSYDSPVQVITCGGDVLKPVAHYWSRFGFRSPLCSKKGLLFIGLLTIGVLSFLHLSGKDHAPPLGQCDAQDATMPCHSHNAVNPLQRFLRPEGSIWKPSTSDPEQSEAPATQEGEQEEAVEQRTNRPRMLTVQGQYEDSEEQLDDQDTSGEMNINNREERGEERGEEESHGEAPISRDYHLRARRAVMGEDDAEPDRSSEEQHSMRILTEEAIPPPSQHPGGVMSEVAPETRSQEYMNGETLQRGNENLEQLYMQHRNLERHGYHREQQAVQQEIERQEMLKHRQQEMWQEQRRQAHTGARESHPQSHPRREHWEVGHPPSHVIPHHGESGGMDRQHPAWRDHQLHGQRLPRGVNPRRYYKHADF